VGVLVSHGRSGLFVMVGGAYDKVCIQYPLVRTLCLREGFVASGDLYVGVRDFGVPTLWQVLRSVVFVYAEGVRAGTVGVGCHFGQGRTGTIMALVLKASGVRGDVVKVLRSAYYEGAVETTEQEELVRRCPTWLLVLARRVGMTIGEWTRH